jgi:hypothetical protein
VEWRCLSVAMDSSCGKESMGRNRWRFLQGHFIKNPRRLHRHRSKPEIIEQNQQIMVTLSLIYISFSISYFPMAMHAPFTVVISFVDLNLHGSFVSQVTLIANSPFACKLGNKNQVQYLYT